MRVADLVDYEFKKALIKFYEFCVQLIFTILHILCLPKNWHFTPDGASG